MSDYKKELDKLQCDNQEKKDESIRLQERLKTLEEENEKYKVQLKELNIDNKEDLEKEIEILEEKIQTGLGKLKEEIK